MPACRIIATFAGIALAFAAATWAELKDKPAIYTGQHQAQSAAHDIHDAGQATIGPDLFASFVEWTELHHDAVLAMATVALAIFTLALVAATIGLLIFAGGQASDTRKLAEATRRSAKAVRRSAKAAAASAKSTADLAEAAAEHAGHAERAIKVTQDAAERQIRAYVGLGTSEISSLDPRQPVTVELRIRNTGRTPAYDVRCYFRMQFAPYPFPSEWMEELPIGPRKASILSPNSDVLTEERFHRTLNEIEIAAIRAGHSAIYVFGDVRYVDVFDKPRRTKFALHNAGAKNVAGRLAFYQEGNEAT